MHSGLAATFGPKSMCTPSALMTTGVGVGSAPCSSRSTSLTWPATITRRPATLVGIGYGIVASASISQLPAPS